MFWQLLLSQLGSVLIPSADSTCPRKVTSFWRKWHLDSNQPSSCDQTPTVGGWCDFQKLKPRWWYRPDKWFQVRPLSARFINRVKLVGPFVNPKGMTRHWNCPLCAEKAVLSLSSSFTSMCQYPEAKYRLEKQWAPPKASNTSSVRGSGMASFCVSWLNLR